jgi:hypothetical protein
MEQMRVRRQGEKERNGLKDDNSEASVGVLPCGVRQTDRQTWITTGSSWNYTWLYLDVSYDEGIHELNRSSFQRFHNTWVPEVQIKWRDGTSFDLFIWSEQTLLPLCMCR